MRAGLHYAADSEADIPGQVCFVDHPKSPDNVQKQLDQLRNRLAHLEMMMEQHINQKCSELPTTSVAVNLTSEALSKVEEVDQVDEQFLDEETEIDDEVLLFEPKGSSWDAMVIIGLPMLSIADNILLALSALLNTFLQTVFCWIAYEFLAQAASDLPSEESARIWRRNSAHLVEYADLTNWRSLASRVCGLDDSLIMSSSQSEVIKQIGKYRQPILFNSLSVGQLLCFVVLLVWGMMIIDEIQNISDAASAFWALPRTKGRILKPVSDKLQFQGMTLKRRCFIMFILLLRLAIAIFLGFAGGYWVSSTLKLEDLLLNGAALLFILEIDELIFETFISERVREIMLRIEPIPRFNARRYYGLEPYKVLGVFIVFFAVSLFMGTVVSTFSITLDSLNSHYCLSGDLNFVVGLNPIYGFAVAGRTAPYEQDKEAAYESLMQTATQGLLDNFTAVQSASADSVAWFVESQGDFEHLTDRDFVYATDYIQDCMDLIVLQQHLGLVLAALSAQHKIQGKNCSDFKQFCGDFDATTLRWACPATCGCADPFSGLMNLRGCKPSCVKRRRHRSDLAIPCRDQKSECMGTSAMELYAASFNKLFTPLQFPKAVLNASGCLGIANMGNSIEDALVGSLLCLKESETPVVASLLALCPESCYLFAYSNYTEQCPANATDGTEKHSTCKLGLCQGYGTIDNRAKLLNETIDLLVGIGYEYAIQSNSEIACSVLDDAISILPEDVCPSIQSTVPYYKKACCSQVQTCEANWKWNLTAPMF